jgi:3-keto-5-aminohexanoate cleavage enzyme
MNTPVSAASRDPLLIAVAPNGAYRTPADHPAVPVTPDGIADAARSCLDAGAAMLHLHVRTPEGRHSLDPGTYLAATAAVRRAVGRRMVVQISTEAAGIYGPAEQMAVVRKVRPEAATVSLRELAAGGTSERELAAFFIWLARTPVMTQFVLHDAGDVRRWIDFRGRGIVPDGKWFLLFVLGRYAERKAATPRDLLPFLDAEDGAHPWAVCAFGGREHQCVIAGAALGGHARVGFENNLFLRDGRRSPDNAALVRQAAEGGSALGRRLARAEDVRAWFHES